jgi:hypothetical protein
LAVGRLEVISSESAKDFGGLTRTSADEDVQGRQQAEIGSGKGGGCCANGVECGLDHRARGVDERDELTNREWRDVGFSNVLES